MKKRAFLKIGITPIVLLVNNLDIVFQRTIHSILILGMSKIQSCIFWDFARGVNT